MKASKGVENVTLSFGAISAKSAFWTWREIFFASVCAFPQTFDLFETNIFEWSENRNKLISIIIKDAQKELYIKGVN